MRLHSGAGIRRYAVAATVYATLMAGMALYGGWPLTARASDQHIVGATNPGIVDQLSHLGALRFNTRLQDAADENVFSDLPVVITISDVVADNLQCHISYRRHVEREERSSDEQHNFALAAIDDIRVEPFESFENEHQGKPGWVYTMTDPEISAVVIVHQGDMTDWFAVVGAEAAKQLAEDIKRRGDYCRRHAAR